MMVIRNVIWGRQPIPAAFPRTVINDTTPGPADISLTTIITDPAGDSLDANDVTTVRAGGDGQTVAAMAIDFAPGTPMNAIGGYVYFDTDQDPTTGLPGRGPVRQADPGPRPGVLRRPVRAQRRDRPDLERRHRRSRRGRRRLHRRELGPVRHAARGARRRRRVHQHRHGRRPPRPVRLGARRGPRDDRAVLGRAVGQRIAGVRRGRARWLPDGHAEPRAGRRCRPASTTRSSCSSRTLLGRRSFRST